MESAEKKSESKALGAQSFRFGLQEYLIFILKTTCSDNSLDFYLDIIDIYWLIVITSFNILNYIWSFFFNAQSWKLWTQNRFLRRYLFLIMGGYYQYNNTPLIYYLASLLSRC